MSRLTTKLLTGVFLVQTFVVCAMDWTSAIITKSQKGKTITFCVHDSKKKFILSKLSDRTSYKAKCVIPPSRTPYPLPYASQLFKQAEEHYPRNGG